MNGRFNAGSIGKAYCRTRTTRAGHASARKCLWRGLMSEIAYRIFLAIAVFFQIASGVTITTALAVIVLNGFDVLP
jgi:hypothetical protein